MPHFYFRPLAGTDLYHLLLRLGLAAMLLLLPLLTLAQEVRKASLPMGPPSREELFSNIVAWQDSLASLSTISKDTAAADSLGLALRKEAETRYRQQIEQAKQELTRGLVPEEAQKILQRLEQVSTNNKNAKAVLSQSSPAQALPQPEELSGMARARALKAAGDHLAGHKAELAKARAELDKYKGRFGQVESVKDMPKGLLGLNALKGRPWPEKIIMGMHGQFGKPDRFTLDWGPYAAWRLTDLFAIGAGAQHRLSASLEQRPYVSASDRVRGGFAFADAQVYKGFFVRAHYELLSAPVEREDPLTQEKTMHQEWVPGLSAGMGRTYTFYKSIKGYGLMQYNLLHERGRTPFLQPFQTRIGFYLYGSDLKRTKELSK